MRYKKWIAALTIAALCVSCIGTLPSADAAEMHPGEITKSCSITVSQNQSIARFLTDKSDATSWKGGQNAAVQIHSKEPIGGLYIIWNSTPVTWTLTGGSSAAGKETAGGKTAGEKAVLAKGGENAFLHEYTRLEGSADTVSLTFEGNVSIGELYVLPAGDPPAWVQQWQPMLDKADLLLASTHADDELLWFGGAMPVYAGQFHKKVQVSYLIHHGFGRTHELLNGLWTVGITNYPMLSPFGDKYCSTLQQAFSLYKKDDILAYQVMLLRRFKPDVVLTQDLEGEYGHGAHRMNSYTLTKALELSGDPAQYPDSAKTYGVWQIKKLYLHKYAHDDLLMNWNVPLSRFGGKTGLEMAREGFDRHVSQVKRGRYHVDEAGKNDNRWFGLYYTAVGPDVKKNDFFEHISPVIPWEGLPLSEKQAGYTPPSGSTSQPSAPPTAKRTTGPTTVTTVPPPTTTTVESATALPSATETSLTTTAASTIAPVTTTGAISGAPSRTSWSSPVTVTLFVVAGCIVLALAGLGLYVKKNHRR